MLPVIPGFFAANDWTWEAATPAGVLFEDAGAPFEKRLGRAAKYSSILKARRKKEEGRESGQREKEGREGRRDGKEGGGGLSSAGPSAFDLTYRSKKASLSS